MWRVVVSVVACACGRVNFDPLGDGGATGDGGGGGDAIVSACTMWNPWLAPTNVGALNSAQTDWAPSLSADGLQLTFSSNRSGNQELYVSTRSTPTAFDWTTPAPVTELTNMFDEEDDPTISTNGLELIFGKTILFRATRSTPTSQWGARAVIVPNDFNLVQGAELSGNDLRLYFSAGDNQQVLYMMERATTSSAFGAYAAIPDPDPGNDIGYPTFSADELEMFVSADHTGRREIFTSVRADRDAAFPQVTLVSELSDPAAEWDPELSRDGSQLWFASSRSNATDIFVVRRTCAF